MNLFEYFCRGKIERSCDRSTEKERRGDETGRREKSKEGIKSSSRFPCSIKASTKRKIIKLL